MGEIMVEYTQLFEYLEDAIEKCCSAGHGCLECPAEKECNSFFEVITKLQRKEKPKEIPWRSPRGHY